ncbi:transposase [Bacillus anthracis]|nr:transposase [Bacillus anthracis]
MTRKSNTTAIIQLSKEKSEKTRSRVEKTISEMALKKERINFNSVAHKANVSKSWLYKQKEIRTRVETLRGMQINELAPRKTSKSPRSEDVLIKTLKSRIKALEEENKLLKDQVQKLYGKLF